MEIFKDLSQVISLAIVFIGVLAFAVSCITEILKKIWAIPPALVVIIVALILCPASLFGLAAYFGIALEWYMVFASFIAAFIVALTAIDGWERVSDLANKLIKK